MDSTQRLACRLAAGGDDLRGVVLWAERQTAGHGRQGRTWASSDGGLYVTAGLPREWTAPDRWIGWAPLLAALNCARLVRERWDVQARLKWPNDVLVDGRKLAGVLGEASRFKAPDGTEKRVLLVGMGLNWTNSARSDGAAGGFQAVSLGELTPGLEAGGREDFLTGWLTGLAGDMERLGAGPEAAAEAFRREAEGILWRRGETVTLEHTEEGAVRGRLAGLSATGGALIETGDGPAREAHCGWQGFE